MWLRKCLFRLVVDLSNAGLPAPQTKAAQTQKPCKFARGSEPFGARRSYVKVALARPNRIRNHCNLERFCFCAGLLLWCWPPCFGQIDDESKKTFCQHHPRTQKLIILKPRGQKLQSQNDDFQTMFGSRRPRALSLGFVRRLRFLATRL